jgi:hypothetical protein
MKKMFTNIAFITAILLIMSQSLSAQVIIGTFSKTVSDNNKVNKISAKNRGITKVVDYKNRTFLDNVGLEKTYSIDTVETITKFMSATPMAGVVSFPFKFRLQGDKDVETSLSLSGVGGMRLNFNKSKIPAALCLLIGLGPSSVPVNRYNSSRKDSSTLSQSAATFSLTGMFVWDKLQIAASIGMDKILTNREINWSYQSKPWFSFGVGFSIFDTQEETAAE